jgi:hypothetical protein
MAERERLATDSVFRVAQMQKKNLGGFSPFFIGFWSSGHSPSTSGFWGGI